MAGVALSPPGGHSWGQRCSRLPRRVGRDTLAHCGQATQHRREVDGHGDLSLLILLPQEPGCGGSEGGHCQQGLETLSLPCEISISPGLASAAGTAQMCTCQQRFAPTVHSTALSRAGNVGGDQGLLLMWLLPKVAVLHLMHSQ